MKVDPAVTLRRYRQIGAASLMLAALATMPELAHADDPRPPVANEDWVVADYETPKAVDLLQNDDLGTSSVTKVTLLDAQSAPVDRIEIPGQGVYSLPQGPHAHPRTGTRLYRPGHAHLVPDHAGGRIDADRNGAGFGRRTGDPDPGCRGGR